MSSLDLTKSKCKVFHLEAIQNHRLYIGTDIKANSLEEASTYFKLAFMGNNLEDDTRIICISEEYLH